MLSQSNRGVYNAFVYSIRYIAIKVWKHFEFFLRVTHVFGSVTQPLSCWMAGWSASIQYGMCRIGVAAFIFREIWVARCRATYDEYPMNMREICLKVTRKIQMVNLVHISRPSANKLHLHILETLRITPKNYRVPRGIWCKWDRIGLLWGGSS